MCGIVGIYNFNKVEVNPILLTKLNDTIAHRGPDNGSQKILNHVGLGHRRLSIIDLSNQANQPMYSEDGRFTIVYNGEVYNFVELRLELEQLGFVFHTHSDTEVILKAYQHYGTESFNRFNGMFAVAIYDSLNEELVVARDHFGIKPIYFYQDGKTLVFASEMKAIKAHTDVNLSISKQGLTEYVWFGNPLGNNTIYEQIKEVPAGSFLKVKDDKVEITQFFSIKQIVEKEISEEEAVKEIGRLFEESIKRHLISDVPVGVFLSGGIDSSAITAIASKHYKGKLKTYSVGFDFAKGPNELSLAAEVASQYNTEHHEVQITANDIIGTIEKLVDSHDEPFGDAADIPLYLLTEKLKGEVKVVLQGDGGDEFFGGYSRYHTLHSIPKWKLFSLVPPIVKLTGIKNAKVLRFQRFISAITKKNPAVRNALLLTVESDNFSPLNIFSKELKKELQSRNPFEHYEKVYAEFPPNTDPVQALFYCDSQIVLKDTFFEKVDKSTMANSMEVRVPFVDKDLTHFMMSVPAKLKVKNGVQKYLLKKAMNGIVPDKILYGKKTGFSVPYNYWLKTALHDYFIEQISTAKAGEYLDTKRLLKMHKMNAEGKGYYGHLLWKTMIFAIWLNKHPEIQ